MKNSDTQAMDKKAQKQTIFITIITLLTLLVAIIGATFAFFAAKIKGNDTASSVLIRSSSLTIEYKTLNEINEPNIKPGFKKTMKFTINNESSASAGYNIYWMINKNEFKNNELIYSLTANSTGSGHTFVTASNKPIPKTTEKIGNSQGVIPNNTTQNYTLTVEFVEKGVNQDENQNKGFAGKIEVRS